MSDLTPLESIAASELVTASMMASLIPALVDIGVLSPRGAREIYENALLLIETQQGDDPSSQRIYEAARELIESRLRPE
jgi:hypothetical protein